jgi:hypothetical protein
VRHLAGVQLVGKQLGVGSRIDLTVDSKVLAPGLNW